jgi:hypothetical protein
VVAAGVVLEPPQPAWNRIEAKKPISKLVVRIRRLRDPPTFRPSKAIAPIGNQVAYGSPPDREFGAKAAVVGGRAVVLTFRTLLCAPAVKLGTGLLVNAQVVAAGKPEVQDNDTLLGNDPAGVTVTV